MNVKFFIKFDRVLYYIGHIVRLLCCSRCIWRGLARDVAIFRKGGKAK